MLVKRTERKTQLRTLPPVYEAVYRSLSLELVALARRKGAAPVTALADIEKLVQAAASN